MSHIPSSAMKHAAPHHEPEPETEPAPSAARPDRLWLAVGGTAVLGALAALPLLRRWWVDAKAPTRPKRRAKNKAGG